MKKVALTTYLILTILPNIISQDILYKKDGDEIKAKVVEITSEVIKYKNFDHLDGPLRNLDIVELFMIIYQDGSREIFANKKTPQSEVTPSVKQSATIVPELTQDRNAEADTPNQQSGFYPKTKEYKKFNWGFQGGLVFPKWKSGEGDEDINDYMPSKASYYGGFFIKISFSDYLSLQTELSYISSRFDADGSVSISSSGSYYSSYLEGVMTLNYVQLPVLLKATFRNSSRIKPSIFLGPSINFQISAKAKGTWTDSQGNSGDVEENYSSDFNSTYFGLTSGIGCVFNHFFIEGCYDFGLSNISGDEKLNAARVTVGFYF